MELPPAPSSPNPSVPHGPPPLREDGMLPTDIGSSSIFPATPALLAAVHKALAWQPPARSTPIFRFDPTEAAAEHNFEVLRSFDFDLQRVILEDPQSPLRPGSEFRPISLLEPILQHHPSWKLIREMLVRGATFPLESLSEQDRQIELQQALEHGNHKRAQQHVAKLRPILEKEIRHGFHLPLPIDRLTEIPGVCVAPLNCVIQTTLNAKGERVEKIRLTTDQSFSHLEKASVNDRTIREELPPCRFGRTKSKIFHYIIDLRRRYPTTPILLAKQDVKAAYRRIHMHASTALQSVSVSTGILQLTIALLALRLTFGGVACPHFFSDLSELMADLANWLVRLPEWNPEDFRHRYEHLIGEPKLLDSEIPFAPARRLLVDPKADIAPTNWPYIDDFMTGMLMLTKETVQRGANVVPFVFDLLGRACDSGKESLPRHDLLAIDKALAEGTPTEFLTVLGWEIDTRRLLVHLSTEKYTIWHEDMKKLAESKAPVRHKLLETTVGRLIHLTELVPPASHFLGRLEHAKQRAKPTGFTRLSQDEREDCRLYMGFLDKARAGYDMNLLVLRHPEHIIETDACDYGIGGVCITSGRGWRLLLPEELQSLHINVKEFLACVVGIWVEIDEGRASPGDCFLSKTDNTTAMRWIERSNFTDATQGRDWHLQIARALGWTLLDNSVCLYSQYWAGEKNLIADSSERLDGLSVAERNRFTDLLTHADKNIEDGVTSATHQKNDRHWRFWLTFLPQVGLAEDPYLRGFNRFEQHRILCGFGQFIRECNCSKSSKDYDELTAGTVRSAIDSVSKTFVAAGYSDPSLDSDTGQLASILKRLLAGMKNNDPGTVSQKAIPFDILDEMFKRQNHTRAASHFNNLCKLAFFFALRSCEYLRVDKAEERRTLPLKLSGFSFWKHNRLLRLDDPRLAEADAVSITFEFQKRDIRDESVTQSSTGDPNNCPVKAAAAIVKHLLELQRFDRLPAANREDPEVYWYLPEGKRKATMLRSNKARELLRLFVSGLEDLPSLGIKPNEIGLHSLRSSAAMAMYLNDVPVYTIMLMGRWSSDAFLRYIRKQVKEFGSEVSKRMIQRGMYFHVPEPNRDNPRTRSHYSASTTFGDGIGTRGHRVNSGSFSVWP